MSRLGERAGSGKKLGCSSLCKRLADVYHRAEQNNYKLFNMSRRLVGLPNCKAKGPSGRIVFSPSSAPPPRRSSLLASLSLFHHLIRFSLSLALSPPFFLFLSRVSFFVRSSYSWRITKLDRERQERKREREREREEEEETDVDPLGRIK